MSRPSVDWSKHVGRVGRVGDWHGVAHLLVRGRAPTWATERATEAMVFGPILGLAVHAALAGETVSLEPEGRLELPGGRRAELVAGVIWDAEAMAVVRELAADAVIVWSSTGLGRGAVLVGFDAERRACVVLASRRSTGGEA